MNLHSGARSCPGSRALLIERIARRGWPVSAAARAAGISRRTAYKWMARHAEQGEAGRDWAVADWGVRAYSFSLLPHRGWRVCGLERHDLC